MGDGVRYSFFSKTHEKKQMFSILDVTRTRSVPIKKNKINRKFEEQNKTVNFKNYILKKREKNNINFQNLVKMWKETNCSEKNLKP